MRFFTNFRGLQVEDGRQTEILIASGGFGQSASNEKAIEYLKSVAAKLNVMTDEDAIAALLNEAENKVEDARLAEKFMEPVTY